MRIVYPAGLMQRLGLSEQIKAKTKLFPSGTEVAEAVAKGDTEIGIGIASDRSRSRPDPAVDRRQSYSSYVAGVSSASKDADAGKALIAFLTSPAVKQAFTANGFE